MSDDNDMGPLEQIPWLFLGLFMAMLKGIWNFIFGDDDHTKGHDWGSPTDGEDV